METEFLTVGQVAERLGLSTWTVSEMARQGTIPSIRLSRRTRRFDWPVVAAAVRAHQEKPRKVKG
jgi:excisionase family DNA binding protein